MGLPPSHRSRGAIMNRFDVQARQRERAFLKKVGSGYVFSTGTGKGNYFVEVTPATIYFRTDRSAKPIAIARKKFRQAMAHMMFRRTLTRKGLEPQPQFSSALMGLLKLALHEIAKVTRTIRGFLRLTLKGCRHYFCGLERATERDIELVRDSGGDMILLSYAALRDDKNGRWMRLSKSFLILLDSGEFSRVSAERKGKPFRPVKVADYADFISEHCDKLTGWLNLDCIGDPDESARNANYLTQRGLRPIPVWHYQSAFENLDALVRDDHPVIAIGGTVFLTRKERHAVFAEIFSRHPTQAFHGLGVASPYITRYDWFSVDSTSWLAGRKFGRLVTPLRQHQAQEDWDAQTCLAFNIRQLAQLEGNYTRTFQMDLLAQPNPRHQAARHKEAHGNCRCSS